MVITFKPKQVTKKLLGAIPERGRDVLSRRFGITTNNEKMTLETIGDIYGITRERVRQLESSALDSIRKSDIFHGHKNVFEDLRSTVLSLGGVVSEDELLSHISPDISSQNSAVLLLALGEAFKREKENEYFKHRWTVDSVVSEKVESALKNLSSELSREDIITEDDIILSFIKHLDDISPEYKNEEIIKRWLLISKKIGKNPLGEWGNVTSPNINARGMRDYSFLVIRRNGSPMHFTEVAKEITNVFGHKAHVATCHNELIKDDRFVLVGRGLYALSDWGYQDGVVKDVIVNVIKKHGPMTKADIIRKVLKERYVKENTIIVNLQNSDFFKKDKDGKYIIK